MRIRFRVRNCKSWHAHIPCGEDVVRWNTGVRDLRDVSAGRVAKMCSVGCGRFSVDLGGKYATATDLF